jgi:hypothetical protein
MHSNLAQISRAWVATSLLNSNILLHPLTSFVNHPPLPTPTHLQLPSQPACLIPWRIPWPTHIPHTSLPQSLSLPTGGNKENVPLNPPLALSQSSIGLNPTARNLNTPIAKHLPRPPSSTISSLNAEAPAYVPTKAPPSPLNKTAAASLSFPKKHHPPPLLRQPTLHKFFSYFTKVEGTSAPDLGDTWGHSMDPIDSSSIFRVILQNVNGIRPFHSDLDFQYGLASCCSFGVGALSIAETKLNINHPSKTNIC